jgi:hypothetical protein
MLDKPKLNFLIDALMFICMMAIAGLAFLMKFILIPGKERLAKYGRGVELLLLGMDRHSWGTIHLALGLVLLGLLVLHIILHWNPIVGLFQRLVDNQKARQIIAPAFVIVSLLFLIAPLAVKPEIQEIGKGRSAHLESSNSGCGGCPENVAHDTGHRADGPSEIRGFMTLAEVSEKYNVPIHCLKTHLRIPESAPDTERLGTLKQACDFTMSDVEKDYGLHGFHFHEDLAYQSLF